MLPACGHERDAAVFIHIFHAMHALSLQSTHCRYDFPSRADACHAVLELVFAHPEKTILIGIDKLGKGEFSTATRPCFLCLPPLPPSPAFVSLSKIVLWAVGVLRPLPPCRAFWRLWQHPLASACAFLRSAGPSCVCGPIHFAAFSLLPQRRAASCTVSVTMQRSFWQLWRRQLASAFACLQSAGPCRACWACPQRACSPQTPRLRASMQCCVTR